MSDFISDIQAGYPSTTDALLLGIGMYKGQAQAGAQIAIPLRTMNRHGLIAGATGTGKTKTLQVIAEQLSMHGVPSLLMDIKGDLSGIAKAGTPNEKITSRCQTIGIDWTATDNPVELLTLTDGPGVRMRATVSEFGPILFSKILGLNDTQGGIVSILFKYCDDNGLPLLDLDDFKKVLQYADGDGKAAIESEYGRVGSVSLSTVLRKVVELEQQGADIFFGEPSFEVQDLVRHDSRGRGVISVLRVAELQAKPKLFSTFMLQLFAEIFSTFPEMGDLDKPKLCLFIDEAHLVFEEASEALLDQIETMIKLIRSKGVGVYFITQSPGDIPQGVLAQLGLKVQHALRAFTAKDRKDIRLVADNYPISAHYNVEEMLTAMGIGEAFVTALSDRGIPTPLAQTLVRPPQSRMDVLTDTEVNQIVNASALADKYNQTINRESAYEILNGKLEQAASTEHRETMQKQNDRARTTSAKPEKSTIEKVMGSPVAKQVGRTVMREVTRGLLGMLGIGGKRKLF
jgi:uncharacterized protein